MQGLKKPARRASWSKFKAQAAHLAWVDSFCDTGLVLEGIAAAPPDAARVVQAAAACCGGQPGQRLHDAGRGPSTRSRSRLPASCGSIPQISQ